MGMPISLFVLLQVTFFNLKVTASNRSSTEERCVPASPVVSINTTNKLCLPYRFQQNGYCKDIITWKIFGSLQRQWDKEQTLVKFLLAKVALENSYQFQVSKECEESFNETYCRNRFPECDTTTGIIQEEEVCRETCMNLHKKCHREFRIVKLINEKLVGTDFPVYWRVLDCSVLPLRNGGQSPKCYYSSHLNTETDKLRSSDCYYGNGIGYHGNVSVTKSGYECQAWSSQCPHRHNHPLDKYPELVNASNWCRNPGGQAPNGPWCYTSRKSHRWEYCNVTKCPAPGPTLSPVIVKAFATGSYKIFLEWNPVPLPFVHGTPLGFRIQYGVVGGRDTIINTTKPGTKYFELHNLRPLTRYSLSLLEFNEHGDGPWSPTVIVKTMPKNFLPIRFTLQLKNKRFSVDLLERNSSKYRSLETALKSKLNKWLGKSRSHDYSIFQINIIKFYNGSVWVEFDITAELINTSSWTATQSITGLILMGTRTNDSTSLRFSSFHVEASPPPPVNLIQNDVTQTTATIGWTPPAYHEPYNITHYTVQYKKAGSQMQYFSVMSVGSDRRNVMVENLDLDTKYLMRVLSVNNYGQRASESMVVQTKENDKLSILVVIIPVLAIMTVLLIVTGIAFWRWWKKKQQRERELNERIKRLMENPYDSAVDWLKLFKIDVVKPWWEIPRDDLTIEEQLGSGAFGVVFKGFLKIRENGKERGMYCAVKMLKDNSTEREMREFCKEINIMSTIGDHPNIAGLIGACTINGPPLFVVKFAPNGCLLDYIQENRPLPDYQNIQVVDAGRKRITEKERIRFAHEIAQGMSYLEKQRYVHRDLAARNILLGKDMVAMVSDFGLSRDVYEAGVYENTTGGILPVRWMAPESLQDFVYNTATDVWSYGVLLWEIESQGLVPYGGLSGLEILHHLQQGYRLPKPPDSSRDLYSIMWKCWNPDPMQRPTFSDLVYQLGGLKALFGEYYNQDNRNKNHIYDKAGNQMNGLQEIQEEASIAGNNAIELNEMR